MAKSRTIPRSRRPAAAHRGSIAASKPWSQAQDEPLIPTGFLTLEQAGEHLHRHPRTVRRMADYGQVQAYRVGRLLVISLESVEAWLKPKPLQPPARNHDARFLPALQQARSAATETLDAV